MDIDDLSVKTMTISSGHGCLSLFATDMGMGLRVRH